MKKPKPWILRPVAWISTVIMLMLLEYAGGFIFDLVGLLLVKLENMSTVIMVILVVAFGSAFLGLITSSVTIIPALIIAASDWIYPSKKGIRYYVVGLYELVITAVFFLAGILGTEKDGSMILYYAECIWLIVASIALIFMGKSQAKDRLKEA